MSLVPRAVRVGAAHALRGHRERSKARRCDVMVLSRAKSGRTWLRAMLSRLYQQHYGLPEAQLIEFDNFHRQCEAVPRILFTHGFYLRDLLASDAGRRRFADKKALFLVRHPCDVAVSEYFQSTRRASEHKRDLYGVDEGAAMFDFVMGGALGLPGILEYLNAWTPVVSALPQARILRYEDLRARPAEMLAPALELLGAPFSEQTVDEAVAFTSFDNLKELERTDFYKNSRLKPKDPSDPDSFKVRRGKVGGYRDYFTPEQVRAMEELVRTRLAPSLGYGHDVATAPVEPS